jgi:hypothetical protein
MFTRRQAIRWAELWLSCWNDRDFDTLLALYREDVRFDAQAIEGDVGRGRVGRVEALKRHWAAAACGIHSAPAELEHVIWDPETRQLAIVYVASLDGTRVRGCDLLTLDSDSRVVDGEPCVGSLLEAPVHAAVPATVASAAGGR